MPAPLGHSCDPQYKSGFCSNNTVDWLIFTFYEVLSTFMHLVDSYLIITVDTICTLGARDRINLLSVIKLKRVIHIFSHQDLVSKIYYLNVLQSNLDIMPPIGTEVKWHSNKSLVQDY